MIRSALMLMPLLMPVAHAVPAPETPAFWQETDTVLGVFDHDGNDPVFAGWVDPNDVYIEGHFAGVDEEDIYIEGDDGVFYYEELPPQQFAGQMAPQQFAGPIVPQYYPPQIAGPMMPMMAPQVAGPIYPTQGPEVGRRRGRGRGRGQARRQGRQTNRQTKHWAITVLSETSNLGAAGSTSIRIRLQHDFLAEDIVFDGTLAGSSITSIFFGDRPVVQAANGIPVAVMQANTQLRKLLEGQQLKAGLDIVIVANLPGSGNLVATVIGKKPVT